MKRILTGIQPTQSLHIGNLFGCINLLKKFKNDELYLFIPDVHGFTSQSHISRKNIYDIIKYYIAIVGKNDNMHFYIQSNHNYVFKLSFILSCHTGLGDLQRMTQFKDKSHNVENVNAGLLYYPVLMAADILSIGAEIIPTGKDQQQHVEISRRIANKFNNHYNQNTFTIPESYILEGQLIYNLQDPSIKMSKSKGSPKGVIFLNDDEDTIIYKIKKAVTDSLPMPINIDELSSRPHINNLVYIYSLCTDMSKQQIIDQFAGSLISVFKESLGQKLSIYINDIYRQTQQYSDESIIEIINQSYTHVQNIFQTQENSINDIIYTA